MAVGDYKPEQTQLGFRFSGNLGDLFPTVPDLKDMAFAPGFAGDLQRYFHQSGYNFKVLNPTVVEEEPVVVEAEPPNVLHAELVEARVKSVDLGDNGDVTIVLTRDPEQINVNQLIDHADRLRDQVDMLGEQLTREKSQVRELERVGRVQSGQLRILREQAGVQRSLDEPNRTQVNDVALRNLRETEAERDLARRYAEYYRFVALTARGEKYPPVQMPAYVVARDNWAPWRHRTEDNTYSEFSTPR